MGSISNSDPNCLRVRVGPFHTVLEVGRDMDIVAGFHFNDVIVLLETESRPAFHQDDPFMILLIVPESLGRSMSFGYDSFDYKTVRRQDILEQFVGDVIRNV